MFLSRFIPVAVVLAAAGCLYHTKVLRLEPEPRPPTPVESVRVLGQEPEQRYTVIAFVSVSPDLAFRANDERLSRRLAQEAAKLGGDAVLLGAESFGQAGERRQLTGKVIVFDREAPPAGSPR